MRRVFPTTAGALGLAMPAAAAGRAQLSLGYSFVEYLEQDAGSAPVGAFLALSGKKGLSPEVDLGWQRGREDGVSVPEIDSRITLNTFTAVFGPRYGFEPSGAVRPFVHVLGGVRHDRADGEFWSRSNTAWGGFAGGGIDVRAGERISVRLLADLQVFFDDGEDLKTLRLGVGLTF